MALLGSVIGDSWDTGGIPRWQRIAETALFYSNYLSASLHGSFTLSLVWSCCVDVQMSLFLLAIVKAVHSILGQASSIVTPSATGTGSSSGSGGVTERERERERESRNDGRRLANALKVAFGVLVVLSICIRASLFEVNTLNLFRLGQYSHFGLLMDDETRRWVESYYGHVWHTDNSAAQLSMTYMDNMYMPTHTRCGPFFVGGFLASCLFTASSESESEPEPRGSNSHSQGSIFYRLFSSSVCWLLTAFALVVSLTPCLPADDDVPVEGQFIATAALRTIAATAIAFLLYRALVPPQHAWHWGMLESTLSLPIWAPIVSQLCCAVLCCAVLCYAQSISIQVLTSLQIKCLLFLTSPHLH